jgi:hypothetical protein
MPTTGRKLLNTAVLGARRDVTTMFKAASERMVGILMSAADSEGKIDPRRTEELQERLGNITLSLFVGPGGRRAYAQDGITPLAPLPRILNKWYAYAVYKEVKAQRDWMQKNIPEDVYTWLATMPSRNTITEAVDPFQGNWVDMLRIFRREPFAAVDPLRRWVPMHKWNDPNGHVLSDRIWQAGVRTQVKIDAFIADGLRQGMSAQQLSKRLEQFLVPGRAAIRTKKPYGSDASYDAMRLARTEIARAANQAAYTASYLNPYVNYYDVYRSARGDPKCKICPQHATIGIGGNRLRAPYPIEDSSGISPFHSHCLCTYTPIAENPALTTERLRELIRTPGDLPPSITPVQFDALISLMLGGLTGTLLNDFTVEELF